MKKLSTRTRKKSGSRKTKTEKSFSLGDLIATVHRLRAPGGCPWDRAQTHQSLRTYLLEEAYEVLDVIDQLPAVEPLANPTLNHHFKEELGDLLMQVLIHAEMANEAKQFNILDVAKGLNEKLIRRHPHVFGNQKRTAATDNPDAAFQTWEIQKKKERMEKSNGPAPSGSTSKSILDGMPRTLPALQRSYRILEKVTKVGFQWPDLQGPLAKLDEEVSELKVEIDNKDPARIEAEIGDVLFTLANVSLLLKVNPEDALRGTLQRVESRFRYIEKKLNEAGKTPDQSNLNEMDKLWNEAKAFESRLV